MPRRVTNRDRILALQACDVCRLRKVKCLSAASLPCERCARLALSCTFNLPTRQRGPKKQHSCSQSDKPTPSPAVPEPLLDTNSVDNDNEQQYEEPVDHDQVSSSAEDSFAGTVSSSSNISPNSNELCSQELIQLMMDDYLHHIHPLIPVVHRPTFRKDLAAKRQRQDANFLAFTLSICAVVVATMPSRFQQYWNHTTPLLVESRAEFVNRIYMLQLSMRPLEYFDEISFQKWAVSYLLFIALSQTGQANRSRMTEVEYLQLGRLLGLHRISEYKGLNHIEVQLRKKGFWLMFYNYVHSQVQYVRKEKLTFLDPSMMRTINLEELLPLEIDDANIFQDNYIIQHSAMSQPNLTSAFIVHSRVFRAAIATLQIDPELNSIHAHGGLGDLKYIRERLRELKYMLNTIPPQLRQRTVPSTQLPPNHFPDSFDIVEAQFGAMRANIHVTHLWLQLLLLDQLDFLCKEQESPPDCLDVLTSQAARWAERESLCSQLLHILHSMPPEHFEPNGLHFVHKVRDVAVGLLACPFEPQEAEAIQATEYIWEFTHILSRLDSSETVTTSNLQTWIDTDRERRTLEAGNVNNI